MRLHALLPALGLGLALLAGCSRDSGPAPDSTPAPVDASQVRLVDTHSLMAKTPGIDDGMGYTDEFSHEFVVDANAGVGFADGFLEFSAEGGAVDHAVAIDAQWLGADGFYGYDFGPDGLQFAEGVELSYDVDGILEAGLLEDGQQLVLYWDLENGTFQEIPSEVVIQNGKAELKATIHHFTKYVIGIGPPPGGGDGGGGVN
jgi:hypothetical protein